MNATPLISIVCPVFNEQACVPLFYDRLQEALQPLRGRYEMELIFTNNASTDNTLAEILKLRSGDPRIQVLTLSRNFGYQASVSTGLRHARGAAMVVIDVDCEDPPELIPAFVEGWEKGYDVVYGKRDRRPEFFALHLTRKAFYRVTRMIADSDFVLDMAEFSLITASVRDAILSQRSTLPFLRSEIAYVGFRRKGISYGRGPRAAGKTNYNMTHITAFAITGILSSSTFPLRLSFYAFPFLAVLNIALLGWGKFHALVTLDFLYIGFFFAVICIYLARIYKDVVGRPLSVVDWGRSAFGERGGAVALETDRVPPPNSKTE